MLYIAANLSLGRMVDRRAGNKPLVERFPGSWQKIQTMESARKRSACWRLRTAQVRISPVPGLLSHSRRPAAACHVRRPLALQGWNLVRRLPAPA
jgi:hypothetical protein